MKSFAENDFSFRQYVWLYCATFSLGCGRGGAKVLLHPVYENCKYNWTDPPIMAKVWRNIKTHKDTKVNFDIWITLDLPSVVTSRSKKKLYRAKNYTFAIRSKQINVLTWNLKSTQFNTNYIYFAISRDTIIVNIGNSH